MRVLLSAALTCCAIVGLSNASEAQAVMRKATNIPAQALRPALHLLSQEREVQVVFRTDIVADLRTSGASGELTVDEALNQLLSGTGLTYRYLDDNTITVVPSHAVTPLSSTEVGAAGRNEEEARKGFWNRLRLSQTGPSSQSPEVASRKDTTGSSDSGDEGSRTEIEEVRVIAAPYRFLDADTSGTTNLPLPIESVPQSITLLSADFMRAAGINKASAVDNYVAGVTDAGEQGGWSSGQFIRGFLVAAYRSTMSRYLDGLTVPFDPPDLAFFDRIEIVKGPSSVTYGVATPGGLFNYVSKHAPKRFEAQLTGEVDSWDSRRIEAEAGGPINEDGSLRAVGVGVYDEGGSFVHHVDQERKGGYAALEYSGPGRISGAIRVTHMKRSVTPFDGLLNYTDGRRPAVSRGFFMGDPDHKLNQDISLIYGNIDWAATDRLSFSAKASYQDSPSDTYLAYGYGGIANDGTYRMDGFFQEFSRRTFSAALNGLWWFPAFGQEGSFLSVTATYLDFDSATHRTPLDFHGVDDTIVNINSGEAGLYEKLRRWTINTSAPLRHFLSGTEIKLLSAQTVIKATDRLSILAGSSISDPKQYNNTAVSAALTTTNFDRQTSLRGGLAYEFRKRSNIYLSYSDSFEPQPLLGTDLQLLPPLEAVQYEAGIKSRPNDGNLLLTAAVFRIEQKNTPAVVSFDLANGTLYHPQGKVRHQGVELEASGRITPSVTALAALTYLDAQVIADSNPNLVGTRRTYIPRQSASAFVVKGFDAGPLKGFNIGGGIRYVGSELTTSDNSTMKVDSYTVIDLIGGFRARRWSAQLALNNILDEDYVQGNNYQHPLKSTVGEPRNVRLSVSWDFGDPR